MADSVSVITATRNRIATLSRAMASVARQTYDGPIEHVIVLDADLQAQRYLQATRAGSGITLMPILVPRTNTDSDEPSSVYPRLARLLNIGIRAAGSTWIAFLDDDNEYEPDHLAQLVAFAHQSGSPAVHSARQMLWPDGRPYLEEVFPGPGTDEEQRRIYDLLCRARVCTRGSNVVQDQVDPVQSDFRNSTQMQEGDPVFMVDQNLWLVRRDLLLRIPVPEEFTERDAAEHTCPDDKMLEALCKAGVPIRSNRVPSVKYYLGGVSNSAAAK